MPTVFEPAKHDPKFDALWQQYLARLRNTDQLIELVGDSSSLEGDFGSLEDVVAALVTAVDSLQAQLDLQGAKVWISFNGSGTIAIRVSDNVASIIDNGTGDYTVTFEVDFSTADYCAVGSTATGYIDIDESAYLAGSLRFICRNATGAAADTAYVNLVCHGDQ